MKLELTDSRSLLSILKALHQPPAKEKDAGTIKVVCRVSPTRGLVLSALLPHRTCQLHAALPKSAFHSFETDNAPDDDNDADTDLLLCVDLDAFTESAGIFGGTSAVPFGQGESSLSPNDKDDDQSRFGGINFNNPGGMAGAAGGTQHHSRYQSHYRTQGGAPTPSQSVSLVITHDPVGSHLILTLQNARVKSVARLKTLQLETSQEDIMLLETQFGNSDVCCKITMKSIWLTHAISELDPSTDTLKIHVSPRTPHLRISSRGLAGETVVEYMGGSNEFGTASDEADALESVKCDQEVAYEYKYSVVQPALKTLLVLSTRVSLRLNGEGMLSMQFMVPVSESTGVGGAQMGYVNFVCLPDIGA
ncbi:hypothetical protein BCR33DRAFT_785659 [Rhizoclosmatium globosum]|uniref:Rad1-domain-containing protein n=1 Tax=Rhizoclosmatium globosum TaxID=329046 RepID=A0A1Y2CC15_9FUNG|nr:hypothetical protein BCR33DRAFT_785659 [Rhizoclosmatium globosum]|eukprot:ORY43865.1 hypothetical protein BCR33DRAFT_785659 [Rhizoclosmatium globosum]